MESISLSQRTGFVFETECYATGAVKRPTKRDPERFWYGLDVSESEEPALAMLAFCEPEHAEQIASEIRATGSAVKILATFRLSKRETGGMSLNVESFEAL